MITYNGKILLSDNTEYTINKYNLMSFDVQCYSRADFVMPSFGIISNYGNVEVYDKDGALLNYIKNKTLGNGNAVHIYLTNTLYTTNPDILDEEPQKEEQITNMHISNIDYDAMTKIVSLSLTDRLEQMQEVQVEGLPFDKRLDGYKSPLNIIYDHLQSLSKNWGFTEFKYLDDSTKKVLKDVIINYRYLENGSLWQQWEKLCVASQCHIYKNNSGKTIFKYNGGN